MHRDDLRHTLSDRGLWFAFLAAATAGSIVAFFIAP